MTALSVRILEKLGQSYCSHIRSTSFGRIALELQHAFHKHFVDFIALKVWDGQTGTRLQSFTTHEADVLCLCVSAGEVEVFASGCDGKVRLNICRLASVSLCFFIL